MRRIAAKNHRGRFQGSNSLGLLYLLTFIIIWAGFWHILKIYLAVVGADCGPWREVWLSGWQDGFSLDQVYMYVLLGIALLTLTDLVIYAREQRAKKLHITGYMVICIWGIWCSFEFITLHHYMEPSPITEPVAKLTKWIANTTTGAGEWISMQDPPPWHWPYGKCQPNPWDRYMNVD